MLYKTIASHINNFLNDSISISYKLNRYLFYAWKKALHQYLVRVNCQALQTISLNKILTFLGKHAFIFE